MRALKRARCNHTIGSLRRHPRHAQQLFLAGMIQVERVVTRPSFMDALRHSLGILLEFGGGLRRFFAQVIGVVGETSDAAGEQHARTQDEKNYAVQHSDLDAFSAHRVKVCSLRLRQRILSRRYELITEDVTLMGD